MGKKSFFKKSMVVLLALALCLAFPVSAFAADAVAGVTSDGSGKVEGESTLDEVVLQIVVPTKLDFSIDNYKKNGGDTGQIFVATDFSFVNKTDVPVKVGYDLEADLAADVKIVDKADVKMTDDQATDKEVYFGMISATSDSTYTAGTGEFSTEYDATKGVVPFVNTAEDPENDPAKYEASFEFALDKATYVVTEGADTGGSDKAEYTDANGLVLLPKGAPAAADSKDFLNTAWVDKADVAWAKGGFKTQSLRVEDSTGAKHTIRVPVDVEWNDGSDQEASFVNPLWLAAAKEHWDGTFLEEKVMSASTAIKMPSVVITVANGTAGVGAFKFYAEMNTYADWQDNDIKVKGNYNITPLLADTYTGYDAYENTGDDDPIPSRESSYVEGTMNLLKGEAGESGGTKYTNPFGTTTTGTYKTATSGNTAYACDPGTASITSVTLKIDSAAAVTLGANDYLYSDGSLYLLHKTGSKFNNVAAGKTLVITVFLDDGNADGYTLTLS